MDKTDNSINAFAQFISDVFRSDVEVLKLDASKIATKVHAKAFNKMINDTKEALDEIVDDSDIAIQDKIESLSIIMRNAAIVDIDDMNTLTHEEAINYCAMIKVARNKFDSIMRVVQDNINCLKDKMAHPKGEDEDLTKLSKEELIERLRRK